jgi:hypothetical protein
MSKNNSNLLPKNEKSLQQTNRQKKFLKKPNNKKAKNQYFRELLQDSEQKLGTAERLIKNDLETFGKILQFADISKESDLKVLRFTMNPLLASINREEDQSRVETFFNFAHHDILVIMFQLLIALKKIVRDSRNPQWPLICVLGVVLSFFNFSMGLKRVEKLLRNTEGVETISQPRFWEPLYFSPKLPVNVKIASLWFSVRISRQKSFTEQFVEKYVDLARGFIHVEKQREGHSSVGHRSAQAILCSISQFILESEQAEFLMKLASELPERSDIIPTEWKVEKLKTHSIFGKVRALVRCANCKVSEKLEK